ncbi:MAG TPA: hypothetical protein VGE39_19415, partial [Prosthecobacter sp.]
MWLSARLVLLICLGFVIGAAAQETERMQTRLFHVPPQFASIPFSLMDPPRDVREMLQRAGIASPPGATARLYEGACQLAVTNTPANLGLVQAFVEEITVAPARCVTTLVTVIEGPEDMMREAAAAAALSSDADATPQLMLLLDEAKVAGAQVRVVGECFLEAPTGTRATSEAVREHTTLAEPEAGPQGRATANAEIEVLREGLSLELETTRHD